MADRNFGTAGQAALTGSHSSISAAAASAERVTVPKEKAAQNVCRSAAAASTLRACAVPLSE
jgi:hypothetical protein